MIFKASIKGGKQVTNYRLFVAFKFFTWKILTVNFNINNSEVNVSRVESLFDNDSGLLYLEPKHEQLLLQVHLLGLIKIFVANIQIPYFIVLSLYFLNSLV
jgi:hypothetical protein